METIRDVVGQEIIERQFNRLTINKKIREVIEAKYMNKVHAGVKLLEKWLDKPYYKSKQTRLETVKQMDLVDIVTKILIGTSSCTGEGLFTGVSAQLAGSLGWSDKPEAIKTMAEMIAVVCDTDAYDVRRNENNSMIIVNRLVLPKELLSYIENSLYLPPMICKPLDLNRNTDTGYLTFKDSLLLGKGNHHDGDICLDALNIANSMQLRLDTQFVSKYELKPTFEIKDRQQQDNWNVYKKLTYRIMTMLATNNNKFYLTNRVDKRGRVYSQGYHCNLQGNAYSKACIELANEELIDVPTEYRL